MTLFMLFILHDLVFTFTCRLFTITMRFNNFNYNYGGLVLLWMGAYVPMQCGAQAINSGMIING